MTEDEAKRFDELAEKKIALFCNEMREMGCDAVQVMVTWTAGTKCTDIMMGGGNWYARQGMAKEFIERDRSHLAAHEVANAMRESKEDD